MKQGKRVRYNKFDGREFDKRILIEERDPTEDDYGGQSSLWLPISAVTDAAEAGTTTTNIKMTAHDLSDGDYIVNTTRGDAVREVTVVDVDNVTVAAVTAQASGDVITKKSRKLSSYWSSIRAGGSREAYSEKYNDFPQDTTTDKILMRNVVTVSTAYRVRLLPSLTRIYEIMSVRNVEEDNRYLQLMAREILQ